MGSLVYLLIRNKDKETFSKFHEVGLLRKSNEMSFDFVFMTAIGRIF